MVKITRSREKDLQKPQKERRSFYWILLYFPSVAGFTAKTLLEITMKNMLPSCECSGLQTPEKYDMSGWPRGFGRRCSHRNWLHARCQMAQNYPPKRIYGSLLFTIVLTKGRFFFEPELFELHVPVCFRRRMINLGDSWSFFGSDFTTQTTRLQLCLIMSSFIWYPNILMVDLHVPYICHIF